MKSLKGDFNDYFMNVVVVMQNYLSRGGDQIMQIDFNGKNGVNLLLDYALYVRNYTQQEKDDLGAANYLSILMTMMEFVTGMEGILPQIMDMIFETYQQVKCKEIKCTVM